jgi:outer membrane protein
MKKIALALCAGAALASSAAMAAQGDILARFRVINVNPDVKTTGLLASPLSAGVQDDTIPELDFTYMITNNVGAELILGTSRHSVTANRTDLGGGNGSIGKVSVLPPTLTLQYHFNPEGAIRPYVGAGLNYTRFYRAGGLSTEVGGVSIKKNSFGPALQVGMDVAVTKNVFLNVDLKKIWIDTKATGNSGAINGVSLGKLEINPLVFGVGVGMKF